MTSKKRPATGRVPPGRARPVSGGPGRPKPTPPSGEPSAPMDAEQLAGAPVSNGIEVAPEAPAAAPPAEPEAAPAPKPPARKAPVVPAKGPTAEAAARREEAKTAARERRIEAQRARKAEERKRKMRTAGIAAIAGVAVIAVVALLVAQAGASKKQFSDLSAAAGCTSVKDTTKLPGTTDRTHLSTQQIDAGVTVTYSTSPPSGGEHYPVPLPKGVYDTLSTNPKDNPNLYMAVHSLEHGYVDIWYKSPGDLATLRPFATQDKVLVISYPTLPQGEFAMTVWGRLQHCNSINTKQVQAFIDNYKIKYGPEPNAA